MPTWHGEVSQGMEDDLHMHFTSMNFPDACLILIFFPGLHVMFQKLQFNANRILIYISKMMYKRKNIKFQVRRVMENQD